MEMRLWLEGPDVNDGVRSPLANGIQSLPLAPHVFRIRLVGLLSMIEGPVAIPRLVGVFFEEPRRLGLGRFVAVAT